MTAINATPLAHDAKGNLAQDNTKATQHNYAWDFDNRMSSADVDGQSGNEIAYTYDALGRRLSKTVPDGQGGTTTTVFVSDSPQVIAEYPANAAPTSADRKFVYATYIDEPVAMVDLTSLGGTAAGSEELYYYHPNNLYSVVAMTDSSANVVERYAYTAYGSPTFHDPATALYYYRARYYDSEFGRFVGRDPIGYDAGDVNWYSYCSNRSLTRLDPTGLQTIWDRIRGCYLTATVRGRVMNPKSGSSD